MRAQQLASVAGTTVRTIRYYHERGLLGVPDGASGWRSYGFAHLTRLMRIRWLVDSGVPLAEVPHMLRPPRSGDERATVREDLHAVLTSIDERIAVLTRQRTRVATLLERVTTEGRLSPLPASIDKMYAALLERPLPPETVQAMTRERDLLELVCYHGALPDDVVALVDALSTHHLDDLCGLWEECHRINESAGGISKAALQEEVAAVVRRTVDLGDAVAPDATRRLLARTATLDRPAVRTAVDLAYPSVVYREFMRGFVAVARERGAGS